MGKFWGLQVSIHQSEYWPNYRMKGLKRKIAIYSTHIVWEPWMCEWREVSVSSVDFELLWLTGGFTWEVRASSKSLVFILWGASISVENVMVIHSIDRPINRPAASVIPRAMPGGANKNPLILQNTGTEMNFNVPVRGKKADNSLFGTNKGSICSHG